MVMTKHISFFVLVTLSIGFGHNAQAFDVVLSCEGIFGKNVWSLVEVRDARTDDPSIRVRVSDNDTLTPVLVISADPYQVTFDSGYMQGPSHAQIEKIEQDPSRVIEQCGSNLPVMCPYNVRIQYETWSFGAQQYVSYRKISDKGCCIRLNESEFRPIKAGDEMDFGKCSFPKFLGDR